MKRITSSLLALLLALSMLIGMVPAAYAAPADTIESIDSTETVDSTETEDVSDESEDVAAYAAEGEEEAVTSIDLNTFIKWLADENYSVDGSKYSGNKAAVTNGKLNVTWSPVSGCLGNNCTQVHEGIDHNSVATDRNVPNKVNSDLAQFYIANNGDSPTDVVVSISNVRFTFNAANFVLYGNTGNKGTFTASTVRSGQLYFRNTGNVIVENCEFEKTVLTTFEATGETVVSNCSFKDVYNSYAIKDIRGANITVKNTAITNCGGGIMISQPAETTAVNSVTLTGNVFTNVDSDTEWSTKPTTRGIIQIQENGVYTDAALTVTNNTATSCGPVLRQRNNSAIAKVEEIKESLTEQFKSDLYTENSTAKPSEPTGVAMVGTTTYNTLGEAISALNSTNYTLTLLDQSAWDTATPVYWEAGTKNGYAATLTDALTAAYKVGADNIKIVCRPGADVSTMTHGHVADNITIYGNNAYISGGECELEVDTYKFSRETGAQDTTNGESLTKDITITAYELDNLGVWGQRTTGYTVTVNLTDCDGKAIEGKENVQRVYISGTSGVNNITLTGCDFMTNNTSVYSNADGAISIKGCSFTGSKVPVNFNHKANGEQRLTVSNSTFKNCGDNGEWNQFAAPVRFVNSGSGTQTASVNSCTFTETVGSNGDILIGDGRTGEKSNDVSLTVTGTTATVKAQKPGYYDGAATDTSKGAEKNVTSSETVSTSIADLVKDASVINDEKSLRKALYEAPTDGTVTTIKLEGDVTLEMLYAAENFGTEKLEDNAEGDTFNRYKRGVHPTENDPDHWNPLVTGQTQEERVVYGAYYHMSAGDERIARLVVKAGQSIVLDLNGHTIQKKAGATHGDWSVTCTDILGNYGTLTITDTSNGEKGTIKGLGYTTCQGAVLHNYKGAVMNVGAINVDGNAAGMKAGTGQYVVYNEGGNLSINGANIFDTATSASLLVNTAGAMSVKNAQLYHPATKAINAKDGTVTIGENVEITSDASAIFATGSAVVTLNVAPSIKASAEGASAGTLVIEGDNATIKKDTSVEMEAPAGYEWRENVLVKKTVAAKIGSVEYGTLTEAIAAVNDGETIVVNAGTYAITELNGLSNANKAITITAADNATVILNAVDQGDVVYVHGAKITFNGITFNWSNDDYRGFKHASELVYNNCTINGKVFLYAASETFNNCTFNQTAEDYNVWTYGAKKVAFNKCTFNCKGKAVNVYIEANNASKEPQTIEVTDVTVKSEKANKAFLNIKNSTQAYNVSFSGTNTVSGLDADGTTGSNLYQVEQPTITETSGNPVTIKEKQEDGTFKTVYEVKAPTANGTEAHPYTLDDLSTMTRAEYIAAQERLGGTMYVTVGDYSYETNGTLGNGTADNSDRDSTKMNYYGAPGAKEGQYSDAAVGKNIVFVGGKITSGVTGYESIDKIGTSLLLAVPAYTNVTFRGTEFNNVMSFNYQLYTSPWSQLGELKFDGCTFNSIIVGAIAAQTLTFNKCTFTDYTNTVSANSSNPTWIRPAYGNWTKGDNEGQGSDFKSLTTISFTGNTVTSTRPVKFERIAQWEMPTTVTVTGNSFDISAQTDDTSTKNVGLYFGANAKFDLIAEGNTKSNATAGLYTGVYSAPDGVQYAGLPAGSTVKDSTGTDVELEALTWKAAEELTLKTTEELASVTNAKGTVNFASLSDAIAAAADGDTVTLLKSCSGDGIVIPAGKFNDKGLIVEFNNYSYTVGGVLVGSTGTKSNAFQLNKDNTIIFQTGKIYGDAAVAGDELTNWTGAPAIMLQNYSNLTLKNMEVVGGEQTVYTMSNNNGNVLIEDSIITAGKAEGYTSPAFAFDACGFGSYVGPTVTVKNSTINGDIEISYDTANEHNVSLSLETGTTISGKLVAGDNAEKVTVTKSNNVTLAAPSGYKWVDGTLTKITYVAKVGMGKEFTSLQEAINYAEGDNDTVTLLADTTEDVVINKDITLDLGGKTLTNTNAGKATISVTSGTVTVKNGNVVGGTSYYNIEVTKDSNANLTLEGVTATAGNTGSSMIDNWGTLTITSGTYTGGLNVVKSEEGSKLTITGGTFTLEYATNGYTGVVFAYGDTTISGGEFIQNLTTTGRWNHPTVILTGVVEGYTAITRVTGGHFVNKMSGESIFRGVGKGTSDNFEVSGGTFNKSISEDYCADGFIPTKNADGTYGVKEGKYVAKVGSKKYETLADAIRLAANGKTITLLANVTENVEISKGKRVTLDLNGYTLNGGTGTAKAALTNYGTITIKDSSAAKTGTIKRDDNGTVGETSYYVIRNQGTMTIESGIVINNSGYKKANPTGSMVGSSLICNGDCNEGGTLTIKGGTFTQNNFIAIKNGALGVLHVSGGTITSNHSAIQNWFKADITGGEIKGQLWTDAYKADESVGQTTIGGDAKFTGEIVMDIAGSVAPTLAINGGNLNVTNWRITSAAANAGAKPAVSGGTFDRAVLPEYCADGFIPTQNADGTYGVKEGTYVAETGGVYYESLQAAIDAARRNGTVKLLADTRENVTISTPYLTLDLNGHTLNGGTEKGKPALTVTARVTVKDGSEAQTGTIKREDTAENSGVSSHYVIDVQGDGWLTFESGNVKNESGNANGKGASLVRVGNDEVRKFPGLNIKGGTFTQDNFIVIKVDRGDLFLNGGTLNSANSYAIEDWHRATIKGGTVNGAVAAWTYSGGLNSDLTISGGTINGDVTSVNYGNAEGKTAKVSITGGTINGKLDTRSYDPATNELTSIDDAAKATIEVTGGTFNNDPTKYVVENSKVTNNGDGTFGVEKAYLAKVGETSYYTMDEAFKAQTASGEPILLLRDHTTGSTFNSGTINRTVDLNGHTWTCTGTDANSAAFEINNPNVTLTVKNGKIVSSQLVGLIPSAMGGTIKYDNSGLVFEGVEMSTTATSGIETNGNNTNDSVTLKNSTLNVPNGFGIYFPSSGTLTIENSTINAKTMGVQVCAGSLSINEGSAITVSDGPVDKTENDGAIQDGAAISIVNRTGYKGLGTITVTGGTFTAKTGNAAIKAYNWANNNETDFTEPTKVEVSGGTFSAEVPADLCAPGYVPKDNGNGTYGVAKAPTVAKIGETEFTSLKDAIATAEAGATIDIVSDINTPTVSYEITKNLTINLNNKKITADGYDAVFQISGENANVVLNGPGEVVAVENTGSAGKYAMAVWACGAGCTVTINGEINFSQNITHTDDPQMDMIYASKGTIIINDGHYKSGTPAWTLNCKDAAYKDGTANIIVNGGTFVGCDPRNNTAEGEGTSFVAAGVGVDQNTDGTFTAKPNMVAQIVDADGSSVAAYATLKEAVDAAKNGETVTLLADVDLDAQIATGKAITINGQGKYTIKATKKLVGTSNKAGMFYRTTSAQGTLTFLNVTLDGNGVSKIFLNEGGAGETVFDGVTSINGGGISYGSGIHISGGGSHATIKNSTLTGSKGTTELSEANYFAANDLWVGGNVYVTVENSTIGYVFVNSAPSATATNNVVHGQLTITGANTRITYLSGEEEAADKLDKFGNNGSLVKIDSGNVETIFDKGSYEISGGTFKTEVKPEWCADGYVPVDNGDGTYTVDEISTEASYIDADGKLQLGLLKDLLYLSDSKGKKLTIYKDIEIDYVVLLNDRELNLNGHTLTVNDTFVAVTGSVKDTEDGKGLIKIDAKNLHLAPNNGNVGQIPIFDSAKGGYRLFNFTMTGRTIGKGNGVEVDLRPEFTNPEAYELMKAGSTNNITFTVTISWMSENGPASQEFIFVQRLVDNVADKNGNGFFFIILNGLDSDMVGSIKDIKAQGSIKSGTGVSVNSVYYDIPQN